MQQRITSYNTPIVIVIECAITYPLTFSNIRLSTATIDHATTNYFLQHAHCYRH